MTRLTSHSSCHMLSLTPLRVEHGGWGATMADIARNLAELEPLAEERLAHLKKLGWSEERIAEHAFANDLTLGCYFEMRRQFEETWCLSGRPPVNIHGFRDHEGGTMYPTGED